MSLTLSLSAMQYCGSAALWRLLKIPLAGLTSKLAYFQDTFACIKPLHTSMIRGLR